MQYERRTALAARAVQLASRSQAGRAVLRSVRKLGVYRALLGYRRPFASLAEAKAALAASGPAETNGHDGAHNVRHHLELSGQTRPSDYAALFHLRPLAPRLASVFDLGGNAGNLYYCYARYLAFREDLTWTVQDLPANMAAGEEMAEERDVRALRFTGDWSRAAGVDLLLVSGSLHYLETPLPQMLAELSLKPAYILINRTPLVEGASTAAVANSQWLPAALHALQPQRVAARVAGVGVCARG